MKKLGISEFKAKCIDELKKVQQTQEPLVVTWRKKPIATIYPYRQAEPKKELGRLRGHMKIHGDIVHGDGVDEWEMET